MAEVDFLGRGWKLASLKQTVTNWMRPNLYSANLNSAVAEGASESQQSFYPYLELAEGEESIREAICIILGTHPGERIMRPDFGSNLHELIFDSNNAATATLAEFYVKDALQKWEPRIEVLEVTAGPGEQPEDLDIRIDYRINSLNTQDNLVYPFHLERAES